MEAYIKHVGNEKNYNRFGKFIPKEEKRIDICKFFGISDSREKNIIDRLSSDSKLFFKLVKSAGETVRQVVKEVEEKAVEVKTAVKEPIKKPVNRKRIK